MKILHKPWLSSLEVDMALEVWVSAVGRGALLLSEPYKPEMTHCFNNKITSVYIKGVLF